MVRKPRRGDPHRTAGIAAARGRLITHTLVPARLRFPPPSPRCLPGGTSRAAETCTVLRERRGADAVGRASVWVISRAPDCASRAAQTCTVLGERCGADAVGRASTWVASRPPCPARRLADPALWSVWGARRGARTRPGEHLAARVAGLAGPRLRGRTLLLLRLFRRPLWGPSAVSIRLPGGGRQLLA